MDTRAVISRLALTLPIMLAACGGGSISGSGREVAPFNLAYSVVAADFNNDGALDLAVAVTSISGAIGDLNADGRPDLAVANDGLLSNTGSISVLLQKIPTGTNLLFTH